MVSTARQFYHQCTSTDALTRARTWGYKQKEPVHVWYPTTPPPQVSIGWVLDTVLDVYVFAESQSGFYLVE